jgi:hypothetical protein
LWRTRIDQPSPPTEPWFAHIVSFTPAQAGRYALVFVRDNDVDAQLFAAYGYCGAPVLGESGVAYPTPFGTYRAAFDQVDTTWAAIGVRGNTDDWGISLYRTNGGPHPECLSDRITTSNQAPTGVEFVVGDFHRNPLGLYYAFATDRDLLPAQGTNGIVEYDGGRDVLEVNGNAALRLTNGSDVLETWDVFLEAGRTYDVEFTHVPGVDARVFLFGTQASTFFAHRRGRLLESTGWAVYTAPYTGWYGVVVTNDDGGTGTYTLRISTEIVDAEAAAPAAARLLGVAPNPSRAPCRIDFELARDARAEIDVLDLRGRRVRRFAEPAEAGRRTVLWDGKDDAGTAAPAGMYLVRLRVDGHTVGERKLIRIAR